MHKDEIIEIIEILLTMVIIFIVSMTVYCGLKYHRPLCWVDNTCVNPVYTEKEIKIIIETEKLKLDLQKQNFGTVGMEEK